MMKKGFLAREFDRASASGRVLLPQGDSSAGLEAKKQNFELGSLSLDNAVCCNNDDQTQRSGDSLENLAFFDHDGRFEYPPVDQASMSPPTSPNKVVKPHLKQSVSRIPRKTPPQAIWFEYDPAVMPRPPKTPPTVLAKPKLNENGHSLLSWKAQKRNRRLKAVKSPLIQPSLNTAGCSESKLRQAKLDKFLLSNKKRSTIEAANESFDVFTSKIPPPSLEFFKDPGFSDISRELDNLGEAPKSPEIRRSQLADNFMLSIKLTVEEERLLLRFKYMFDSAVRRLKNAPPFPMGLHTFRSSMLEVQLDSTNSQIEHQSLLQALCAGQSASRLLREQILRSPREMPEWARLPEPLPGSVLKELSRFLHNRNMVIVLPEDTLRDLHDLAEKLRALGITTNYAAGPLSWDRIKQCGTWLLNTNKCPEGSPQLAVDGVILPTHLDKWPQFVCGSLTLDIDLEWAKLRPSRTAFVDNRLPELIRRLNATNNLTIHGRPLNRYGVDLCTADLGAIFTVGYPPLEDSGKEVIIQLIQRALRAAQFFRHVVLIQLSPKPSEYLNKLIECVETKASYSGCQFQVVATSGGPVEGIVTNICEYRGNDLSDFAFLTLHNSKVRDYRFGIFKLVLSICYNHYSAPVVLFSRKKVLIPLLQLANIIAEENPEQNPHAILVTTLL